MSWSEGEDFLVEVETGVEVVIGTGFVTEAERFSSEVSEEFSDVGSVTRIFLIGE